MDDTTAVPERAALTGDTTADVAIVGAGIVGVTLAYLLAAQGVDVALIEADRVGGGVSGHTTAKLSALQGTMLSTIASSHDLDTARAYAAANHAGIEKVFALAAELGIDCDLRRRSNHTYATTEDGLADVRQEAEVARAVGLEAELVDTLDLPFPVTGAVRLAEQGEFHPRRYLLGLAEAAVAAGARIHERTRIVSAGIRAPIALRSESGAVVRAERVVIATHYPILDRGLFFARVHAERSYAITARIRGALPADMYLSADAPSRSIRTFPHSGEELLMVGGEGHRTGFGDVASRYRALELWAREHFDIEGIVHRFSSQDAMPVDHLPFIGPLLPGGPRILTATGFQKWGLAMGTTAAEILAEIVQDRGPDDAGPFDPRRLNARASAAEFAKSNALVGLRITADRLKRGGRGDLNPGEGAVVRDGRRQTARSRDADGVLHAVSARCTHLGCIVSWNSDDHTWDCPCHGGRFAPDGRVLEGPPVHPLQPHDR